MSVGRNRECKVKPMPKYRKRPVVIDAFRLGAKGQPTPAPAWFGSPPLSKITDDGILIPTLEGDMLARWGDYVIRGLDGVKFYPCRRDVFERTYVLVADVESASEG